MYRSDLREQAAEVTKGRVLNAAKLLFARRGIDGVTIAEIAERAGVAGSTVYALFKSKEGILRALMEGALFGPRFREAQAKLSGVTDPVKLIVLSAHVARAIYEGESSELGLLRGASAFSPPLRKLEQEFEKIRLEMQEERVGCYSLNPSNAVISAWTRPGWCSGCILAVTSIGCLCTRAAGPLTAIRIGCRKDWCKRS